MKVKTIICVFLLWSHLSYSQNKSYYVSSVGNDANDGFSIATAWQTIAKINTVNFRPGDKILFEGGSTFTGSVQLDQNDIGAANNPILISSYGSGKATIYAPDTTALHTLNTGGIQVTDLVFKGNSSKTNGVYFEITQTSADLDYLYIDNIEVYNFDSSGLRIGAHSTDKGFNDVTLLHSSFHNNGIAGLQTFGNTGMISHTNFRIAYCKFYDNYGTLSTTSMSGNGLVVSGVDGATVEYCEAYNNGANNRGPGGGPVGIWVYDTKNVTIQHCESHHNKAGRLQDGGGFDIDGGSQNCIVQYCYSHDNEGPGLLMVEYGSPITFTNNVIRYNISQNDGRKNSSGAVGCYAVDPSHQLNNSSFYNNTVYVDAANLTSGSAAAVTVQSQNFTNVQISNNIFFVTAGVDILNSADALTVGQLHLFNNNYYSSASDYHFKWNGNDYISLATWKAAATGQEMNGSTSTGIVANPLLMNPGAGGTVDPAEGGSFNSLFAYKLNNSSPVMDQGVDLLTMGATDFFGASIPFSSKYDLGASEYELSQPLPVTIDFTAVSQASSVVLNWKAYSQETIQRYEVLKSNDGTRFNTIATLTPVSNGNYSFNDPARQGNTFYRVRFFYPDGRSGSSRTLRISAETVKQFSAIYTRGQGLQVKISSDNKTVAFVHVYNAAGALLSTSQRQLEKGQNDFIIHETAQWKPGTYFLSANVGGIGNSIVKFVKP
jgi:hypothetical protein